MYNEVGVASMVKCTICTGIEKRITTIYMKKDNFNKHTRWKCATRAMPNEGVVKEEWYCDCQNKHFKNKKLYASFDKDLIVKQLNKDDPNAGHKKQEQLATIFWLRSNVRPLKDYPSALQLFQYFGVPCPRKH